MLRELWTRMTTPAISQAEVNGLRSALLATEVRSDSWMSNKLGHGTSSDKAEMFTAASDFRRPRWELDNLYRSSGLIQKIVNLPINDMTRRGITIEHERAPEIQAALNKLRIFPKSNQAGRYGRIFQLGAVFFDAQDGLPLSEPINLKRVRRINLASVHDAAWIRPYGFEWWDMAEPTLYERTGSMGQVTIHRDRLMLFDGIDTGLNNRMANNGLGESCIDAIYRPFRNLDVDYNAASTMAKDYRIPIFKLSGFEDKAKNNTQASVDAAKQRYRTMKAMLSVINGFVMGEHDSMEYLTTQVNGYAELVKLTKDYLCFVSGIPHTKLFNEGTGAGLNNGKGESEDNDWINVVEDFQEHLFRPQLDKIIAVIAATLGIFEPITYHFNPLVPETPLQREQRRKTRAEAEKTEAEADHIRLTDALVTRQEVRVNRFIDNKGENADHFMVEGPEPPKEVDLPSQPTPEAPKPVADKPALDLPTAPDATQFGEPVMDSLESLMKDLVETLRGEHGGLYLPPTE